jgi:hypothetical protein
LPDLDDGLGGGDVGEQGRSSHSRASVVRHWYRKSAA